LSQPGSLKWAVAHSALQDLFQDEVPAALPGPQRDRLQVFQDWAVLYLKYLQIFRSLEEVYKQLVQPQRRRAVRTVLDGLMGRLLELKAQMVDLNLSEFNFFDDLLPDLKMTPKDLEMPLPRCFLREQKHKQTVWALVRTSSVQDMSLEEVVRLLQVSERAWQGRIRSATCWSVSWFLWFLIVLVVPQIPAEPPGPSPHQLRAQQFSAGLRLIQDQNEEEYQRVQLSVKCSVLDMEGTDMKESLRDQIQQWFSECRDVTGKFPDFPDLQDPDGRSASLFTQKTPEQVGGQVGEQREKKKRKTEQTEKKKKKEKKKTKETEVKRRGSSLIQIKVVSSEVKLSLSCRTTRVGRTHPAVSSQMFLKDTESTQVSLE
uniref:IQ motif containing with AAA domain 1 n=1 Tax=Seriola dumerili TaxID=41447 RepID=A0A3B4THQ9_SERDU